MLALLQWCIKITSVQCKKKCNLASILHRNYPIIPGYPPILFTTYYSQNYTGIIDACPLLNKQDFQCESHKCMLLLCFNLSIAYEDKNTLIEQSTVVKLL